jgi:hypothetical protein
LIDGSILSAPIDPHATLVLPERQVIGLPPREVAPVEASPNDELQLTIPSPQIHLHPPNLVTSPENEHHNHAENANGLDMNIYVVSAILIIIAIIVAVIIGQY